MKSEIIMKTLPSEALTMQCLTDFQDTEAVLNLHRFTVQ